MSDEYPFITHGEIVAGLSPEVRRELVMALPPRLRGWWTVEEIADQPGDWIEVTDLSHSEPRFIPGRGA